MKKLLSILLLFAASFGSAQEFAPLTKTGYLDQNGTFRPVTSATVYVAKGSISSVEPSGSGSYVYLKQPQKLASNITLTGYSVTATPAQINAFITSTSINIPVNTTYSGTAITALASEVVNGVLTVGSTTAMTITLPTTALLVAQTAASIGSYIEFSVINTIGSGNTVTIAVGSGMTASAFPGSNTLTLGNSATTGIARFRIHFISATASTLTRIN